MKKLIAIIASLSIIAASSVMIANANENENINESPVVTPGPDETPGPIIGGQSRPNGKGGAGAKADNATVSVVPEGNGDDVNNVPKDDKDDNKDENITVNENPLDKDDKNDVIDVLGPDNKDDVEHSTYDVENGDPNATLPDGSDIVLTVPSDLTPNDNVTVVADYGDGWGVVDNVVFNDDGTISILLDDYGKVSIWVGSDTVDPATAPIISAIKSLYTSSTGDVIEIPTESISAQDAPSKAADYTVVDDVDYTVVSPQTGYDTWVAPLF